MSKKIGVLLVAVFALVSIGTANAQIKLGVRGGVDIAGNSFKIKNTKIDNKLGYNIGAALDVKVPIIGLGVETGARFAHKQLGLKGGDDLDGAYRIHDVKSFNYITVPLLVKQNFSLLGLAGIYIKGGMYWNYKVSGGDIKLVGISEGSAVEKYSMQKVQKGIQAGAGVTLLGHVELGIDYRHRLGRLYSDSDLKALNKVDRNAWSATLAYYF